MNLNDIYQSDFISSDFGADPIADLAHSYGPFMPEIDSLEIDYPRAEKQKELEVRTHFDPYIDGRRVCTIRSFWFKEKPFMITRSGGREGRDEYDRFVTDIDLYRKVVDFCRGFEENPEEEKFEDIYDPTEELETLEYFYNHDTTPENFGVIPHRALWIRNWLEGFTSEYGWPYSWQGEPPISQKSKQNRRWKRYGEELERAKEGVGESFFKPIIAIYNKKKKPRKWRIEKMLKKLEKACEA